MAAASAKYFGTDHKLFTLDPAQIELDKILNRMSAEPLLDVSFIPTYILAQKTREHVKMVLTGDGGDELFAGYPTYASPIALRRGLSWALSGYGMETFMSRPINTRRPKAASA